MKRLTQWTPAEDAALKEHYPTDLSLDLVVMRVCEASGNRRSRGSIIGRANRFGLQRDGELNRELWLMKKSGLSQAEMGLATGMTRHAANGRALRHEESLRKDARDLEICAALDAGESGASIARRFGVQRSHVSALKAELDKL